MIDGIRLIDAHVHAARLPTLKVPWDEWVMEEGDGPSARELYDPDGTLVPDRFDAFLEQQGVDLVLMLAEYSPRVTGIQPIEDLLPLVKYNSRRIKMMAALNPHVHYPLVNELERQLEMGALALKIHAVHGGFPPNSRELYPVYWLCQQESVPVVFHCGTSNFPGSSNRFGNPILIEDVAKDFPDLTIVLAHGGRGWWYEAAGFLSLLRENVWIEISGLPPKKLPAYYGKFDLERLARKFIFGSDWPGAPGIRENAVAVSQLGLPRETLERIFFRNALRVYRVEDAWVS